MDIDPGTAIAAAFLSLILSVIYGFGDGIRAGIGKRVSGFIAGPRRKNQKQEQVWIQRIFWFLVVAAIAYGIMEYGLILLLLILR